MKFELPLPPTTNHIFHPFASKSGRVYTYKSTEAKRWQADAVLLIKSKLKVKKPIGRFIGVYVDAWFSHDRDIDSVQKVLYDAIQQAGLVDNDRNIIDERTRKHTRITEGYPIINPRLEVDVVNLDSTIGNGSATKAKAV